MKRALLIWFFVAALVAMGCSPPPDSIDSFGSVGTLQDSNSWIEIWDWYDLDAVRNDLSGSYVLMTDLDSTSAGYDELASPTANHGKGWEPIGRLTATFKGSLDGREHEIRDLFIDRPDEDNVGLLSCVGRGGIIEHLGLTNGSVTANNFVGTLAGRIVDSSGIVISCYSTGSVNAAGNYIGGLIGYSRGTVGESYSSGRVEGSGPVGGLVGANHYGIVRNSHSSCSVIGGPAGGLVGWNLDGVVVDCQSTAVVTGGTRVGGLAGHNDKGGTVANSYHSGTVSGSREVGGQIGMNQGMVSSSYSTGSVTGSQHVGGAVGLQEGIITNSYSTCSVAGDTYVGGLAGSNYRSISDSYSIGNVAGNTYVGGLVGVNYHNVNWPGVVSNSFWDTETSGQAASDGGTGKTTAEMMDVRTFSDPLWSDGLHTPWDITAVASETQRNNDFIWNIVDTETYPFLSWEAIAGVQTQCVESATGTGEVCLTTSHGVIEDLQAVPPHSLPSVLFPHGMFDFKITGLTPGQTVTLTIEFPSPLPIGTLWWKYDNGRWHALRNENDNGDHIMVITLKDGGVGDLDSIPGQITDPGGPGNPMTVGWEGSPVNKAAVMAAWIVLLAVVSGASLLMLKRRRTES